ncbi:Helix-turn-helix [Caminicella sporogenes DSM 14501]|uniref:Helix-turn-helix n=1 Tax=Caminicella sporogenes DSM 14501 TaxID=1121266 RepID=A0A1M6NP61_9FIRM|nr:helix-turn-helix domain-containing protein [Caminicella sporogenes]WIF95755.1 helix-turn-helix domain-containing protein [Caminicella sporogenes]SHJ97406.1 Helix-turn-helix [Caminicella sporogenes DSM 14501]
MYNEIDNKAIGERIRQEREKLGLTREKFAEIVELSPLYIGQLERGERQMSLNTLFKISECLHISIDYLVKGSDKEKLNYFVKEIEKNDYLKDSYSKSYTNEFQEFISLINKCSKKEISIFKDIIKIILPHLKK